MATQANVFIRKFGKYAVVITVTDWDDFKELEKHSEHESPDLLLSGIIDKNIYTNMNPSMLISTRGEVQDITDQTKGVGIGGILTGSSPAGAFWSFRKIDGLCAVSDILKPKVDNL